jgi:hypothetical protein
MVTRLAEACMILVQLQLLAAGLPVAHNSISLRAKEVRMILGSFQCKWAHPSPDQMTPMAEEVQEVKEVNLHMAEVKEAPVRILTANKPMWHIPLERRCLKRRSTTNSA